MRRRQTSTRFPTAYPAALLALSVMLCGGAYTEASTAAAWAQVTEAAAGGREQELKGQSGAVASLLSYLTDAAKELQKLHDQQQGAQVAATIDRGHCTATSVTRSTLATAQGPPHPLHQALPHHLDLPPPAGVR